VLYHNATNITFLNQTVAVDPETIKFSLALRGWGFKSARNSLGITFAAGAPGQTCTQIQNDASGNVQWLKLISPSGAASYARFIQTVLLDDKFIYGTFSSSSDGIVELSVPHFWNYLLFDPNFSLLVTDPTTNEQEGCNFDSTFGISDRTIAIVVVFGTVGTAGLIIAFIYGYRKFL